VTTSTSIKVGVAQEAVWIRVEGKGSFQISTALKEFAKEMLSRGHTHFVVDLKECAVMDSTFMGTLAGIASKIRMSGGGELLVVNLNERNHSLLCNLGLDMLLKVEALREVPSDLLVNPCPLVQSASDKLTEAKTMLEAHEAVVEASPATVDKFKDLLDFLRQDIQARQ
jgi:anti-anti-sigma factor